MASLTSHTGSSSDSGELSLGMLRDLAQSTARETGVEFMRSLTREIADSLGVKVVFIGALDLDSPTLVRSVAFWKGDHFVEDYAYDLAGTPCEVVVSGEPCVYPRDLQALFPDDLDLVRIGAESYLGLPLLARDGRVIGLLGAMDVKPLEFEIEALDALEIFAMRVSAEMEREQAAAEARAQADLVADTLACLDEGVCVTDLEFAAVSFNVRFAEVLLCPSAALRPGADVVGLIARGAWTECMEPAVLRARLEQVSASAGQTVTLECARENGVTVSLRAKRINDERVLVTAVDISDHRRREAALERANRDKDALLGEFNAVLDTIEYGVLFMGPDLRARIVNRAFADMWNMPADFVKSSPTMRELLDFNRDTHVYSVEGADWERYADERLAAVKAGPFGPIELRRADGRVLLYQCTTLPKGGRMLTYFDITHRIRAEEGMRESEERFRDFAELSADWFWETDPSMCYQRISGRLEEVTGLRPDALIGVSQLESMREWMDDRTTWVDCCAAVKERRPLEDVEVRVLHPDGDHRVLRANGRPFYDEDGEFLGYRGATQDITEEHRMAEQLAHQAAHDDLTGLYNRREFDFRLERAVASARECGDEHALCYLDLDQFKVINDTCGHIAGDELLRQLGALFKKRMRRHDTLARLGGDEFGVLLEHCVVEQARRVTDELRKTVEDFRFAWDGKIFSVGVSIGVVPITGTTEGPAQAMSTADAACYAAKENGRNRVHVALDQDDELRRHYGEMQWVVRLNRALEENRFELFSQPIVPVHTDGSEGLHYELLLRMRDEEGTLVPPGAFLPAAERYGVAPRIDRWVVTSALEWLAANPNHLGDLSLCSINLSGHSLGEADFLAYLTHVLRESPVSPDRLCFEITETAAIHQLTAARHFIRTLKDLGCQFALDDFGSGVSSFAYLKRLDVDFLKIDGLFVKDIESDPVDLAMVRSISEMGRVMGKRTIAEFVENDAVLSMVRDVGVDYAQGYGVGRPAPLSDLLIASADARIITGL